MPTTFIGTTFPPTSQWYRDEIDLIQRIKEQIDQTYGSKQNLFINTTWFGPQFDNGEYQKFISITERKKFDNLFLLAAADPVFLNAEQIQEVQTRSGATQMFLCGHFDGAYQFNFHSLVIPKYFQTYATDDLLMTTADHIYICYNRKPRSHRVELVRKLIANGLQDCGIITLGKNDPTFSQTNENDLFLTIGETPDDFAKEGNWNLPMDLGIPHDIHSLGNMQLWRSHFITIVSETEFFPWDNLFVSEKTWKPILGLRPFLINGQTGIYKYLCDHGFRTFTNYFDSIQIENVAEYEVHDSIIGALKFLQTMSKDQLSDLHRQMLPDLLYNRERFFEFAKEQRHRIDNLF